MNKDIRRTKRRGWKCYVDSVLAHYQEAWERRDMATCWRLARALAGTKVGPRFRRHTMPTAARRSLQEWHTFMAQPA
eukprot:1533450-Heterocapsa_arctica.AAC.1